MIRFACTCGHRLEVPAELAGDSIQCPACGLLVDVPTLSDLASFTEDGTYRMDDTGPAVVDADRMADVHLVYAKTKLDAEGNEIDLRTLPAGRKDVGGFYDDDENESGEFELKPVGDEPDVTERPKYDPETGELIRPIDVRHDPERDVNPASIPVAKPAIQYAGVELTKRVSPLKIAAELLMPMNIVVMFFVLCTHFFSGVMFVTTQLIFFIVPAWLILQGLILAHYGNVVDDTGRNEHDSLPRPLRDLGWYEDIWSSFVSMFGGLLISFGLPMLVLINVGDRLGLPAWPMVLIGGILGTVVGPAVLLTTNTSGSSLNLRPDRVLKVIRICGLQYVGITLLWAVTWPVYFIGWLGFDVLMRDTFGLTLHRTVPDDSWIIVVPALLAGTYLMHYFCWYLGLLYRAHHAEFPWVFQRHIRDPDKPREGRTHADQLGRRRPAVGHLPPVPPASPPAPPPPTRSHAG